MRILLIAPHPFYQERGTPIAVDLLCRVLSRSHRIDICTFHEGSNRSYPNVEIYRIKKNRWLNSIKPGFSIKKIVCDILLFLKVQKLVKTNKYDLIHAVEEAAFIAQYINWRQKIPFVYDIDSTMSAQLIEKMPWLSPLRKIFTFLEAQPMKKAIHVIPICQEQVEIAKTAGANQITLLKDVSLVGTQIQNNDNKTVSCIDLREQYNIDTPILMYIGNLEHYQGIDLLLHGFATAQGMNVSVKLVIIGGNEKHIVHYKQICAALNIADKVIFTGPMPVNLLSKLMSQANFLVSPRTKGGNTPMKIYSYMDSKRAILATKLDTHTQVLTEQTALLCDANKLSMAEGIRTLLSNSKLTDELAKQAQIQVKKEHSFEHFEYTLNKAYLDIENKLRLDS